VREFLEKVLQHNITDGKSGRRKIDSTITNEMNKIVVSASARQRAVLPLTIENLEN
jgi:hypothetical protein